VKHDKNEILIDYYLQTAILKIREEYELKYDSRALAPDRLEILQRHPDLVIAIFNHLSRTKAKISEEFKLDMEVEDDLLDD
tara:strand:+ start:313 stop:555 length:243 start_codon:yes stop_codon:yes gene_type:complete